MTADTRNTKIVVLLIGSLTLGATVLLWLEPAIPGWSPATLLIAESVGEFEDVRIEYVQPGAAVEPASYDCVITPTGGCLWQPSGSRIGLAVVGSELEAMPQAQAEKLLAVFGSMTQRHGIDLGRVWLDPASDARLHPELPAQAHDLCKLLVRKGIIP